MSAEPTPTLVDLFRRMEMRLQMEPETVQGEIVGRLRLLDTDRRTIETFANVRGRMTAGAVFVAGQQALGDPFGPIPVPLGQIFA
jgi:hypothetical protein